MKKLFFPGEFYEAFIYMQRLLLFNEGGGFFYIDLEHVARYLEDTLSPDVKSIATHLFARNDWLAGDRFSLLLKNPYLRSAFLQALDLFPNEIVLGKDFTEYVAEVKTADLLDVTVYNQRLYLGTDQGLYDTDLEIKSNEINVKRVPGRRMESACSQVNVKYGSVTISCGNDGLFTHFDEFDVLGDERLPGLEWIQTQAQSQRTAWLFENLVNYTTSTTPALLEVERTETPRVRPSVGSRRERIATKMNGKPDALTNIFDKLAASNALMPREFLYVYNTSGSFFVQTQDRLLYYLSVSHSELADGKQFQSQDPRLISQTGISRILNTTSVRRNTVLELYDSVQLLSDGQLIKLVDGEALSVKSFPGSRRFQNLVTIVTEDGVYVISLFDEREFRASKSR